MKFVVYWYLTVCMLVLVRFYVVLRLFCCLFWITGCVWAAIDLICELRVVVEAIGVRLLRWFGVVKFVVLLGLLFCFMFLISWLLWFTWCVFVAVADVITVGCLCLCCLFADCGWCFVLFDLVQVKIWLYCYW